jgi:peptidyl-prolyl cis-trans isomerase C
MKIKPLAAVAVSALLALGAAAVSAQNIAIVNGKPIPTSRMESLMREIAKSGNPIPEEMKPKIKEELIIREIFVQEAERRGLAATPEYAGQMELARQSVLIKSLFDDQQKNVAVSEADIAAEYKRLTAANSSKEYKASHILVAKESEAKDIIAKLKKGAKFEDLAKKMSTDKGSGANGGSLDWVSPGGLVKEFGDAMVKLNKGQTSDAPVKSEFGYHIIRVEDSRQQEVPKLADVRPQIEQQLKQQKLSGFQNDLRAKAKVE